MRARVVNGRWVLEDPTGLPEGTTVEIVTHAVASAPATPTDVYLDDKLRDYIHALLALACSPKYSGGHASPDPKDEHLLAEQAKAFAARAQRRYTIPQDVKQAAPEILRRIVAQTESVQAILDAVAVP